MAVETSWRSNQPTEILMAAEKAMKKSLSSSNYKGSVILSNTNATRITWSKPDIASVVPAKRRSVKRMIFDDMVKSVSSLVFYCCSSSSSSSADPEDELSNSYGATCRSKNAEKNSTIFPDPSQLNWFMPTKYSIINCLYIISIRVSSPLVSPIHRSGDQACVIKTHYYHVILFFLQIVCLNLRPCCEVGYIFWSLATCVECFN